MDKGSNNPKLQPPQYGQEPPPAYPGQQPSGYSGQQSTVILTQQPHVLLQQTFRELPVRIQCPSCHADIMTATSFETGTMTWIAAGALCLFGLWLGCCLIPFCVDACKDVVHSCPSCRQVVGKYNRIS